MLGNVSFDEIHENTYKLKRDKNFLTRCKQIYIFQHQNIYVKRHLFANLN